MLNAQRFNKYFRIISQCIPNGLLQSHYFQPKPPLIPANRQIQSPSTFPTLILRSTHPGPPCFPNMTILLHLCFCFVLHFGGPFLFIHQSQSTHYSSRSQLKALLPNVFSNFIPSLTGSCSFPILEFLGFCACFTDISQEYLDFSSHVSLDIPDYTYHGHTNTDLALAQGMMLDGCSLWLSEKTLRRSDSNMRLSTRKACLLTSYSTG